MSEDTWTATARETELGEWDEAPAPERDLAEELAELREQILAVWGAAPQTVRIKCSALVRAAEGKGVVGFLDCAIAIMKLVEQYR